MDKRESVRRQQAGALGQAVRARRRALGLTQKALGLYAGVGVAFIYDVEKGKSTLRLDKLLDLLEVLGLQLAIEPGTAGIVTRATNAEGP